ncbi:MAG: hypothetical protein J0G94_12770 [Sphingomonadales bacterium]|nr:hypothetical protein [Sphingomonadales bacterium]
MPSLSLKAALSLSVTGLILTGCSSRKESSETAAAAVAQAACDRACLIKLTDQYLAAVVKHDPGAVPLAENLAFVENIKRIKPGEGLWKSATGGPTDFKIYVPDVDQQQAGWMGIVQQEGKPVLLALRLKLVDGKITEAEHIVAAPARGNMDNLTSLRPGLMATSIIPEAQRKSHDELVKIGLSYYDALDDNDGSKMPFAPDCSRNENGLTTAGEGAQGAPNTDPKLPPIARDCKGQLDSKTFTYIDKIENRRLIAADPVTGLAMGFSHLRHPMNNLPYKIVHVDGSTSERNKANMPFAPFDMPAAHIFKIGADGLVHEIEAAGIVVRPNNQPTGWE